MKLYEQLSSIDVIGPVANRLGKMGYRLEPDVKIRPMGKPNFKPESPWLNAKVCPVRNCGKWLGVYFLEYGIISRNCFNCWKIICRMDTVKDAFAMRDWQVEYAKEENSLPCKVGAEKRIYGTPKGIFGAFWYNPLGCTLEEARENKKDLQKRLHLELGLQFKVNLKRACTEMEESAGPSSQWQFPEQQTMYEDLLDAIWVVPRFPRSEPTVLEVWIKRAWIHHALECGEKSAHEYVENMQSLGIQDYEYYDDGKLKPVALPELGKPVEEENMDGVPEIQGLEKD